jgi:hypothetical protein
LIVVSTSGGLGEAETAGVVLNVIPRDGGNKVSGDVYLGGTKDTFQSNNITDELKARGLPSAGPSTTCGQCTASGFKSRKNDSKAVHVYDVDQQAKCGSCVDASRTDPRAIAARAHASKRSGGSSNGS